MLQSITAILGFYVFDIIHLVTSIYSVMFFEDFLEGQTSNDKPTTFLEIKYLPF